MYCTCIFYFFGFLILIIHGSTGGKRSVYHNFNKHSLVVVVVVTIKKTRDKNIIYTKNSIIFIHLLKFIFDPFILVIYLIMRRNPNLVIES